MSKNYSLFELINGLTKNEKRFFKLSSKRNSDEELKYIVLFDIYDSYNVFDDSIIEKEINSKLTNVRYLKHQLYLQLLRSLNAYNYTQENVELKILKLLQNASILINKGLFNQSYKIVKQAKIIAKEYGLTLYLLECFKKEKYISRELYNVDWFEYYATEGALEEKKWLSKYEETYAIYKARNDLMLINNTDNYKNSSINELENFILNLNTKSESSFEVLEAEYITKAYLHITKKEYLNARKFQQLLIHLFENFPNQINLNLANYLSALYNLLVSNFIIKDFEQVEPILHKLDYYRSTPANRLVKIKLFNYLNIGLAYYNLKGDFEKSISYELLIIKGLTHFNQSIHLYAKMSLFLHLTAAYIGVKEYEKAYYWVNKSILEIEAKNTSLHFFVAKILRLIVIFEEKKYTYLTHLSRDLEEELIILDNDYQSFVLIVNFFKSHKFNLLTRDQLKDLLNEFKKKLEPILNIENEKIIFDVFDIITWLNSHLYNQPFDYLVKIKFKTIN